MIDVHFTSDSHFFHFNIIKYCNRPFITMEEMHRHMIEEWNSTVTDDDIVIHLGDFICGGSFEQVKEIVDQLNGFKILVTGNHEKRSTGWLKRVGFDRVHKNRFAIGEYLFSHIPNPNMDLITEETGIKHNFHGHSHKHQYGAPYYNFGVDVVGYKPKRITLNLTEEEVKNGESRRIHNENYYDKHRELPVNQTNSNVNG